MPSHYGTKMGAKKTTANPKQRKKEKMADAKKMDSNLATCTLLL